MSFSIDPLVKINKSKIWFITGSQHLYGAETLEKVSANAAQIVAGLNSSTLIACEILFKPIVTSADKIFDTCLQANADENCVGIICWMHTFSPAKMWINGLKILNKPLLHLHTQFNSDIPFDTIDMDFMNLNQSAHGDREFGFIVSRMRINRKVVVGHWNDTAVHQEIDCWVRAAAAWSDMRTAKFARFGDNMRYVAVTEGDKVEAEMKFGFSVNTYGVGDLVASVNAVSPTDIEVLLAEYQTRYILGDDLLPNGSKRSSLIEAARIELGISSFLENGGFKGFTDTFEDLHGLAQLPGIAVQRLMQRGFGFAGEGDWKTAALVRAMKVMGAGLKGGNAFMEDYTYHFAKGNEMVLGSHMLEICASIALDKPRCEIYPLGIGGKEDPVRLIFNVGAGEALNASLVDMGNRFRLVINEVEAVTVEEALPKLPVARVFWKPKPDMKQACAAWIYAGGAHHTCYSQNLTSEHLKDFAEMAGIECVHINTQHSVDMIKDVLRWNQCYDNRSN
jgi:L-arabinose isomerase